jgi:hypothetical protein
MSSPASSPRPRRGERGGISWVSFVLLVLVVGGAYLAWIWLPIYFDHYTVKQVVRDFMNQAIKNPDDAALRRDMVLKIESLASVPGVDASGRPIRVPAVSLDERGVTWQRDASARTLHVAFDYERQVVYPLIDRAEVKVFTVEEDNDLTPPNWGPVR